MNNTSVYGFLGIVDDYSERHYDILIQTEDDEHIFFESFYNGNIKESLMRFQWHKKKNNLMSLKEFEELFNENKKSALEGLFQEPINNDIVEIVVKKGMTCTEIYERCRKHINLNAYHTILNIIPLRLNHSQLLL